MLSGENKRASASGGRQFSARPNERRAQRETRVKTRYRFFLDVDVVERASPRKTVVPRMDLAGSSCAFPRASHVSLALIMAIHL